MNRLRSVAGFAVPLFTAMGIALANPPLLAQPEAKLEASDQAESDQFGTSIAAIDGTALVGSLLANGRDVNTGAVYAFNKSGREWIEDAKLVAAEGSPLDFFGLSVSAKGDCAFIGAPGFETTQNQNDVGAVFVFCRRAGEWVESFVIEPDAVPRFGFFGTSVEFNGSRLAVGAPGTDASGTDSGVAYLFEEFENEWRQQAVLVPNDSLIELGTSVCLGSGIVVAGAAEDPTEGDGAGSVYVYVESDSGWVFGQRLISSDADEDDGFGSALACSDSTIIVGAPDSDVVGPDAGAVYVFESFDGGWMQTRRLTHPRPAAADGFGFGLALRNDTLAIGIPRRDSVLSNVGSAYVMVRDDGVWRPEVEVFADDAGRLDNLGSSVLLTSATVLAGAPRHNGSDEATGAVYAFDLTGREAVVRFVTDLAGLRLSAERGDFDPSDANRFRVPAAISLINAGSLTDVQVEATLEGTALEVDLGSLDQNGDGLIDRIPGEGPHDSSTVFFWAGQTTREAGFGSGTVDIRVSRPADPELELSAVDTVTFFAAAHPDEFAGPIGRAFDPAKDGYSFTPGSSSSFDSLVVRLQRLRLVEDVESTGLGLLHVRRGNAPDLGGGMAGSAAAFFQDDELKPLAGDPFAWTINDPGVRETVIQFGLIRDMARDLESPTRSAILPAVGGGSRIESILETGAPAAVEFLGDSLVVPAVVFQSTRFRAANKSVFSFYDTREPGLPAIAVLDPVANRIEFEESAGRIGFGASLAPEEASPEATYFAKLTNAIRNQAVVVYAVIPSTASGRGLSTALLDPEGNRLSIDAENNRVEEIVGGRIDRVSLGEGVSDTMTVFTVPSGVTYTFELMADSAASVRFERYQVIDSLAMAVEPGFELPGGSTATIDEAQDPWTIELDLNGDGIPDRFIALRRNALAGSGRPVVQHGSPKLGSAYPNPFSDAAEIPVTLTEYSKVTLTVHDMLGRTVRTLLDQSFPPGSFTVGFDAGDLPSGVYFYRLRAGTFRATGKATLVR